MSQVPVTAEAVLTLFDQIASATDDGEVLTSVANVRQHLGGELPSIIIKQAVVDGADNDTIRELTARNEALEARLRAVETATTAPQAENGYYDLEHFVAALHRKMGRTYGWRVDYVKATQETPECKVVKNEEIQRWQQTRKVPCWAFDQIDRLVIPPRKGENGPQWSTSEYDFLVDLYFGKAKDESGALYQTNSSTSNARFAEICTQRFGRDITENAIKGAIDRQRKKGRLPMRRNSKPEGASVPPSPKGHLPSSAAA